RLTLRRGGRGGQVRAMDSMSSGKPPLTRVPPPQRRNGRFAESERWTPCPAGTAAADQASNQGKTSAGRPLPTLEARQYRFPLLRNTPMKNQPHTRHSTGAQGAWEFGPNPSDGLHVQRGWR